MVIFCTKGLEEKEGVYSACGGGGSSCPICDGSLSGYGWRERIMIESDGSRKILSIHRLWCASCEKIHHELPDIIIPYKRYSAETIINIIEDTLSDEVFCDNSTIYRVRAWWRAMKAYFTGVLGTLRAKFGPVFSEPPRPKEIVRAVANANLWASTRSACTSG